MTAAAAASVPSLTDRVEALLASFLREARAEVAGDDPAAAPLVDEVIRVVASGGKRLRPAFCFWGHLAAGGRDDEPILRAASALELLHTMALIHDDLMDGATQRRGVPASAVHLAAEARRLGLSADPDVFGRSAAILAGDLAAVLADQLLLSSGFAAHPLLDALARYRRMRTEMAAGQFLDVAGLARDRAAARRAAALKGGGYTVEGPLLIGAALAGAPAATDAALSRFGAPLGQAFQLRDDLEDGEGAHGATPAEVNALVAQARASLHDAALSPAATEALDALARLVGMP
jgi:geranylgeranyl diphosphate synthase, type I